MAFSAVRNSSQMADMNITPLVDVMLVLLVIFMVTMPLRTYGIGVELPQRVPPAPTPVAHPISIRIDPAGAVTWNGSVIPVDALEATMKVEAARYSQAKDQPEIRIDADRDSRYDVLARVLAASKNAGLVRVGFVDDGQR